MGTSLADQLKRLAAPQTSYVIHEKKKASLLFDGKEAANIDRDVFYQIGLEGLMELKTYNVKFAEFENNLFHFTSKNLQRAVQTQEINSKLDETIQKFLILLSPYFQLKCAHNALEWLIQRFQIHQYNVDNVLTLVLPYHETRMFVRVLQLLDLKNPVNKWHWLYPAQKAGVPLAKLTLHNHCSQNCGFLKFICQIPLTAIKICGNEAQSLNTLFSFCCTTIMGGLTHTSKVSEEQVTYIIKLLVKGLSSQVQVLIVACCLIIAQLVKCTKLSSEFLEPLINKICAIYMQKQLNVECCILLVEMNHHQSETFILSEKAITNLAKSNIANDLNEIHLLGCSITNFLIFLISETLKVISKCKTDTEDLWHFLTSLVTSISIDDTVVSKLIRTVINFYISLTPNFMNADSNNEKMDIDTEENDIQHTEWYISTLKCLEQQYPSVFDTVVKQFLKNISEKKRNNLTKILGFVPRLVYQEQTHIFEKLHHPNELIRVEAVKFLWDNINNMPEGNDDFIKDTLKSHLQDSSYRVIDVLLKCNPSLLISFVGEDFYVEQILKIATNLWYESDVPYSTKKSVITHLCSDVLFKNCETAVLFTSLLYILPYKEEDCQLARDVLKSVFGSTNRLIAAIQKDLSKSNIHSNQLCTLVLKQMGNVEYIPRIDVLCDLCRMPLFKSEPTYQFLGLMLMARAMEREMEVENLWSAFDIALSFFSSSKVYYTGKSVILTDPEVLLTCMGILSKKQLPLPGLVFFLDALSSHTIFDKALDTHKWWDITASKNLKKTVPLLFLRVFSVLLTKCMDERNQVVRSSYANILKKLLKRHFGSICGQLCFLSNLWVSHILEEQRTEVTGYELQLRSLIFAQVMLETDLEQDELFHIAQSIIVPSLCIALSCPASPIRVAAMDLLSLILTFDKCSSSSERGFIPLVRTLVELQEELRIDSEQICVALYKNLSPDPAVQSVIEPKRRPLFVKITSNFFQLVLHESTPLHVKSALLNILSCVNSKDILSKLIPLGKEILSYATQNEKVLDNYRSSIFRNIMARISEDTYKCLEKENIWNFFKLALLDYQCLIYNEDGKITCVAIIAMNQITKTLYEALPLHQQEILNVLVTVVTDTDSPDVTYAVGHVLKRVVLDCEHIAVELKKMITAKCEEIPSTTSKQKKIIAVRPPSVELLKTRAWREGTALLELIQNKKKLKKIHIIVPLLFDILKRCLEFEEQASVEYIKQLLLSCILHCCQKLTADIDINLELVHWKRACNVELVVECIRASQNPQTHHHALLVLSQLAELLPDQVLHNIMAIFTFMGSSVLRQDNAYSFQIISKVVDTVIPILVKVEENGMQPFKLYDPVSMVLRVFVDALLDIPEHRQLPLFRKLLITLGAEHFLWLFMALIIESQACQNRSTDHRRDNDVLPKKLEFAVNVTNNFHPLIVVENSILLMEYLKTLPLEKDNKEKYYNMQMKGKEKLAVSKLFDVENHSRPQFHHFKYAIVVYLSAVMGNSDFIKQVAELTPIEVLKMEPLYTRFIESVLHYIQISTHMNELHVGKPSGKYWKCMLNQSYDLLDKVNALLLSDMFLKVIMSLLENPIQTVRRKAIEILNARLQNQEFVSTCKTDQLLSLKTPLMNIIGTICDPDVTLEQQLIQQTALVSIKLLARLLATKNTTFFREVLDSVIDIVRTEIPHNNVLASALLCCAELYSCLKAFAITSLSKFMPRLVKILNEERRTGNIDLVLLAEVTAVYKVVESLPHFLSPYLQKLLLEISILSAQFLSEQENQKSAPIVQKLKLIKQKLSSDVPPRVLLPAVNKCYEKLLKSKNYDALGPLMDVLAGSFASVSGSEFNYFRTELTNFFLLALQFRCNNSGKIPLNDIYVVEGHVIRALLALVLKLTESTFRPLFYNLYHWATAVDIHKERLITFYRVSHSIAECLKGLFLLVAGHFVKNAASLLEQTNIVKSQTLFFNEDDEAQEKNILLLEFVLKTLYSMFLYDSTNFVNKERFTLLMQPLVDQLENTLGGMDALKQRASSVISPCIVQFAVGTADDSLWKQLNYQILLKTRHSSSLVRLISVETLCGMVRKLGEDFLPQLPETVPFLAELLEDEDETVEKTCTRVVQDMEEILGEPLKKYF